MDKDALDILRSESVSGSEPKSLGDFRERPFRVTAWLRAILIATVTAASIGIFFWLLIWQASDPEPLIDKSFEVGDVESGRRANQQPAPASLSASGYVVARRKATASSRIVGRVEELLIEEGMHVEEGQVLARLDDTVLRAEEALASSNLKASEARVSESGVQVNQAKVIFERTFALSARNLVSQSELDQAQANLAILEAGLRTALREAEATKDQLNVIRRRLEEYVIRAPFSGIVVSRDAQVGEIVSPSSAGGGFTRTGIGTIVDISSLEVEVDVNESYIDEIRVGQHVETAIKAYPGMRMPSYVVGIVPTANRQKATVKVRIAFLDFDKRIMPEMAVQVWFLGE